MEGFFGSFPVRHMIGAVLLILSVVAGITGWALLRQSGSGWRLGRLLSAAPRASLAEAIGAAEAGETRYVRVHGRIDSAEEFPGDKGVPLVYRRKRLQWRRGRTWETVDDERLGVPFGLSERGTRVSVDVDALGDGLIVVPRVAEGSAAELPEDVATGLATALAPTDAVRLSIEQVSSVDHATAVGVPRLDQGGDVVLGPGLDRPLVLTTLDVDEAMRVLAADQRTSLLAASALLVAAPLLVVIGLGALLLGL